MAELIQVLERHHNLIKVKYRGEFGYFWPSTNLTGEHPVKSFNDAERALLQHLKLAENDAILVPIAFDPASLVFIVQGLDRQAVQAGADGEIGTFQVTAEGQVIKKSVE
ncbi:hypothetical protein [Lactobacillus sp. Sy-1]|uniref:hypothetical protein n=1 Tax=Lactobacillus sp. Sy-1 TaxID=2109645 RepID=UPI001C5790F0|nr:hypothetical protein [Lactobacillus sp. Sy-1]MBW1605103.1 hypothetical protein [Lactobacillus sp. Sy-1]